MDWRAMSRSRSRISMDWRPASRSRSRPPPQSLDDFDGMQALESRYAFPSIGHSVHGNGSDGFRLPASKPPPSMLSATRRSPPSAAADLLPHPNGDYTPHFHSPQFGPSSLPSFGLRGPPRITAADIAADQRAFPRHVRKTSFDHTVTKEGLLHGLSGRHQVNGRPSAAESLAGTKRPADAPHAESMLRGDPSDIDMSNSPLSPDDHLGSSFPSSSFDFAFGGFHNNMFSLSQDSGDYPPMLPPSEGPSARSSISGSYQSGSLGSDGLPPLGDGYGLDDDGGGNLDFTLMRMAYPNMDGNGSMTQSPYTHVDPTQILNVADGYPSFHASPSSDGWNGLNSSGNGSPEPHGSNPSTPASNEGIDSMRTTGRKYASLRGDRGKPISNGIKSPQLRSSTSTPDLSERKGDDGKDGDSPTLCTNCQTTNTPLWRRDPEGQPLCAYLNLLRRVAEVLTGFCSLQATRVVYSTYVAGSLGPGQTVCCANIYISRNCMVSFGRCH